MTWNDEQRAEFVLASYEQMQENARAIRARIHLNVQLVLTFYVASIVFFLSHPDQSSTVRWLSAGGFALLAVVVGAIVKHQGRTLRAIHGIMANLEEAMGFHEEGAYGKAGATLYPDTSSAAKLRGLLAKSSLMKSYQVLIFGLGAFGVAVAFIAR